MRHQGERATHALFRNGRKSHGKPVQHCGTGYAEGSEVKASDRTYVVSHGSFRVLVYGENETSDIYVPNVGKGEMRKMISEQLQKMMEGVIEPVIEGGNGESNSE